MSDREGAPKDVAPHEPDCGCMDCFERPVPLVPDGHLECYPEGHVAALLAETERLRGALREIRGMGCTDTDSFTRLPDCGCASCVAARALRASEEGET